MKEEVIIIGGGLGGLTTGALLAKEGHRVTVLEKNETIGGGLQTFKRNGIEYSGRFQTRWKSLSPLFLLRNTASFTLAQRRQ